MTTDDARQRPVQDSWRDNVCFGCGVANDDGHELKSYLSPDGDSLQATVELDDAHTAGYPSMAYGGTVASLIDCHSLWTAITFAYEDAGRPLLSDPLLMYVTGELTTQFLAPTPTDEPLELEARVEGEVGETVEVACTVEADGAVTARGTQTAVRLADPEPIDADPMELPTHLTVGTN